MLWQMETNGEWTVRPARENTLVEYLAVRLILERLALAYVARQELGYRGSLSELRTLRVNRPHATGGKCRTPRFSGLSAGTTAVLEPRGA